MRFCLTFQLEKENFPVEYRSLILSYIKNAISKCNDGKYYDRFFKNTIQKDYCFSVILPKAKFDKDKIELENKEIKILFSTGDTQKTGLILFNAFIAQKNKPYPLPNNNFMVLKSIKSQKQELILNSRAIFKTTLGSGICVRDHDKESNKDKYYIFSDNNFREKLKNIISNQVIQAGFTEEEANEIKVNPIQCKKVVAKHYRRYIDITTGIFEIQGNNEVLQHFYNEGIGSRKSAGFGMVDLVTQDLL
ncbi:CRISPR-associated endoribonuclease Cas6 [Clostridioides difficile]